MAKAGKTKKQKLSGIIDNSSMGIAVGNAEMKISIKVATALRKEMRKHPKFIGPVKDTLKGNALYTLHINDDHKIVYEFKKQGDNFFLNVQGNPTKLMIGNNNVPCLLRDGEFEGNAVLNTFKYANRIMYAILEYIPGFNFKWEGKEKQQLVKGHFNGSRLQYAWYSRDLHSPARRTAVLRFLKLCYGGQSMTKEEVSNIASHLGLNFTAWDANRANKKDGILLPNDNITIAGKAGDKRDFALTLYAKDEELLLNSLQNDEAQKVAREEGKRFSSLIRFDCDFNDYFLRQNNIKLVADLENRFEEICDRDGYDIGFIRWLATSLHNRLKLGYVVSLTADDYAARLEKVEDLMRTAKGDVAKLLQHWHEFGPPYATVAAKCEHLNVSAANYAKTVGKILQETGIDVDVSRTYHEGMLQNRLIATLSNEERTTNVLAPDNSNQRIKPSEMRDRDAKMAEKISEFISSDGAFRVRTLKPTVISVKEFAAYRALQEDAAQVMEVHQQAPIPVSYGDGPLPRNWRANARRKVERYN
ncbi:hypothetical protein [Rhizobium phage RHEph12]|nr:hypothetical protein [Rhizobium phage RHEph12]